MGSGNDSGFDRFISKLSPALACQTAQIPNLQDSLRERLAASVQAWPGLVVGEDDFLEYLAEKVPQDMPFDKGLEELHINDLYVCCACTMGLSSAIEAFEKTFFNEVDTARKRSGINAPPIDELKQVLREKLFVAVEGERPKIASYSGRGELRLWLRVVVAHTLLNLATRVLPRSRTEDAALFEIPVQTSDPELGLIKQEHRIEFEEAISWALASLQSRERSVLYHKYVDQLTLEQISALYHVHRATVSRRLNRARQIVLSRVRKRLVERLRISSRAVDSLIRLVQSQLNVSIRRHLQPDDK